MTRYGKMVEVSQSTLDASCDSILLGRLGRELARVYQDTLKAPVPGRIQALIDQLGPDQLGSSKGTDGSER